MKAVPRALIVDDHIEMTRLLAEHLGELGWECRVHGSGAEAIAAIAQDVPDLVITDLRMAPVDGLEVLGAARAADPELPVIVMTAFGGVDSAIEAMKRGAWHYLTKPVRLDELRLHAERAFAERQLRREMRALRTAAARGGLAAMIGRSASMQALYQLIERVAPSPAPVLVRGESGTGKELVARALHALGPRKDRAFVAVNCTALPEGLLESELFGHARGAFTGATTPRAGLFVEASGGTLFLDEIGDMAPQLQARLLRVLQEGEVRAVGSDESRRVDVRIVAATHQDLEERVRTGGFRSDLYFRLAVVPIGIPALRDRIEDVPPLVEHFLARARARNPHSPVERFSSALVGALARRSWPGNVRELENLVERLVVIGARAELDVDALTSAAPGAEMATAGPGVSDGFAITREPPPTMRELEGEYIAWVVAREGGNKTRAAEVLGVDVSTIHRRLRRE